MLTRTDEAVTGKQRTAVEKNDAVLVLVDLLSRYLATDDFAEDALIICHASSVKGHSDELRSGDSRLGEGGHLAVEAHSSVDNAHHKRGSSAFA